MVNGVGYCYIILVSVQNISHLFVLIEVYFYLSYDKKYLKN